PARRPARHDVGAPHATAAGPAIVGRAVAALRAGHGSQHARAAVRSCHLRFTGPRIRTLRGGCVARRGALDCRAGPADIQAECPLAVLAWDLAAARRRRWALPLLPDRGASVVA